MIAEFVQWWKGRSTREQAMLAVMLVLLAGVILWLLIVLPIERGLVNSKARYDDALETNARIKSKLAALHDAPKAPPRSSAPLQLIITQSAADAGFTLDRNDAQGEGRADISIAAARPTALFPWISSLEAQGLKVESLTAQPAPTQGSISVQMVVTDGLQ